MAVREVGVTECFEGCLVGREGEVAEEDEAAVRE